MSKIPIGFDLSDPEPPERIYTCSACGTKGKWGAEWSWYGSWRAVDEGKPIVYCCSVVCRRQHAADNAVDPTLVQP